MKCKTYGVTGLMDWTTQIKTGKGAVSVHFTGGALTAYGVTPAKFSTSNRFFQAVIENSEQFKSGRIQLLGEIDVPDDAAEKAHKARLAARIAKMPVMESQSDTQDRATVDNETTDGVSSEPTPDPEDDEHQADVKKINVANKYDAVEWLKEKFPNKGYGMANLRTKTAFDAACQECGVEFVFTA